MTKQEFKNRWESDDEGGGITWKEIADVAIEWGITRSPYTKPMNSLLSLVLNAAGIKEEEKEEEEEE